MMLLSTPLHSVESKNIGDYKSIETKIFAVMLVIIIIAAVIILKVM